MPGDSNIIRDAVFTNLDARTTYRGEVLLPCIPSALGHYLQQFATLFQTLGRPLTADEMEQVRQLVAQTLNQGFAENPSAMLLLNYEVTASASLEKDLGCSVAIAIPSLAEQYQHWNATGDSSLFGSHADAKVLDLLPELASLADTAIAPILDVGAGPGRNALPIARRGYPVDALELTPEFATQLQTVATAEALPVTITQADLLDPAIQLAQNYYQLVLLSEVVPHFRTVEQLRLMLVKLSATLKPGGLLLFNCFLARDGYQPDALAREMAQVAWSSLFTRAELAIALDGLPLELVTEESALDYEAAHLPESAWPPTPWFIAWATGKSAFPVMEGEPPMDLRWLLYRRVEA